MVSRSDTMLLFPPSWTLATGSPHLALPMLKGFLESKGIQTTIRDLNQEVTNVLIELPSRNWLEESCRNCELQKMNEPYFTVEDRLNGIAHIFGGKWNAQLGFEYKNLNHGSSNDVLSAVNRDSPFTKYIDSNVIPDILMNNPLLLGFCLATVHQLIPTFQLCHKLRESGYEGFIVLGGNTVSRLTNEMAIQEVFNLVDGLIPFQGEIPILKLYQTLEERKNLSDVPSLIWQNESKEILRNPNCTDIFSEDAPYPDFSGLPVGDYWGVNYINIISARGCYWGKCSYCAIPYGWGHNGFAGQRSALKTYGDMITLMEQYGLNKFKFVDEALSPNFMSNLSKLILSDGLNIEWEGYTRLEQNWCNDDFVDLVGRAGFRKGYFGLEVFPSSSRMGLNKNDRANPTRTLKLCTDSGVKVHFFCMFGYPGTGQEEAAQTVEFVLRNKDQIDTADIFPWTYAKHTQVDGAERILVSDQDWALEYAHISSLVDGLNSEQVVDLATYCEEIIWTEEPRLLHPTYRMISPWSLLDEGQKHNQSRLNYNKLPQHECIHTGYI